MASRTSLFSHKVTSPKESRNRFTDNSKKFFPTLDAENYGIHSPNKIYDLTQANKKILRANIKRENANYSFSKAHRGIGIGSKVKNANQPGP